MSQPGEVTLLKVKPSSWGIGGKGGQDKGRGEVGDSATNHVDGKRQRHRKN